MKLTRFCARTFLDELLYSGNIGGKRSSVNGMHVHTCIKHFFSGDAETPPLVTAALGWVQISCRKQTTFTCSPAKSLVPGQRPSLPQIATAGPRKGTCSPLLDNKARLSEPNKGKLSTHSYHHLSPETHNKGGSPLQASNPRLQPPPEIITKIPHTELFETISQAQGTTNTQTNANT
jgi:hypothetical protein